jgi:hypothetical protein
VTRICNNKFHSKTLQIGIFGLKRNHLATLNLVSNWGLKKGVCTTLCFLTKV